jgi:hypothetical protein
MLGIVCIDDKPADFDCHNYYFRYQLVYACGDPLELPSLPERSAAVQAVMGVMCRMVDDGHPAVADGKLALWQPAPTR